MDTTKRMTSLGRTNKSVGPTMVAPRKPPMATPPPRKKAPTPRRPISPKPLCQRSQQRHEAYVRASMEKMKLEDNVEEKKKSLKRNPVRSRTSVGGSLPPRLPSVRSSQTPTAMPRPQRRQWFQQMSPNVSPDVSYRPRRVREAATQQRFRQQVFFLSKALD